MQQPTRRMPDFVFLRDFAAERAGGFVFAGQLLTDIPRDLTLRKADKQLIHRVVKQVMQFARAEPTKDQIGVWLGPMPVNGLDPPFDAEVLAARRQAAHVVGVRVEGDWHAKPTLH